MTLHVGPGTFLPVKTDDPREHLMHGEWGDITAETAERIRAAKARGGRIVAIGTTSLRLLESAAAETGDVQPFAGETRLFILPGYRFKVIDLLLTNFHLPRSTLFMLVAALAGLDRMKAAYAHAVACGLPVLLVWRRLPDRAAQMTVGFEVLARDGAARAGRLYDRARRRRDAGLYAGRHRGNGEGDDSGGRRRDRRSPHPRQHLSPDAAAGRRADRRARRAASLHELAARDPHR